MAQAHFRIVRSLVFIGAAFVAIGLLRVPLIWVLLVLLPLSVAIAYAMEARRP
jgi:hypothetical protein